MIESNHNYIVISKWEEFYHKKVSSEFENAYYECDRSAYSYSDTVICCVLIPRMGAVHRIQRKLPVIFNFHIEFNITYEL